MSRREREAKMRAAAPKRAAYLAAQAAQAAGAAPAGGARRQRSGWKLAFAIGLVIAVALAAGYALVIEPWFDRRVLLHQSGRPRGAAFGDGAVAIFDAVDVEHDETDPVRSRRIDRTRVTVIDLATGARVARYLFDGDGGCVPAAAGRMWCDLGALAVHDARTFARLARADELVAKAGLGHLVAQRWKVDGALATWALDDGRAAVIDAGSLTARVTDRVPPGLRPDPLTGHASDGSLRGLRECVDGALGPWRGKPTLTAGGATWTIEDRGGRAAVQRKGARLPAEAVTYLSPSFLAAVAGAPVVLHHASIDDRRDHALVSRVADDGAAAWTVDLTRQCEAWQQVGDTLVIVTTDPGRRVLAIDGQTGAIRWTAPR